MELCLEHAKSRHNRSLEGVAVAMGLANHWSLYKWVASGNLPARLIPPFEAACGINLVTRWQASAGGNLLVPIPSGRAVRAADINELQGLLTAAVAAILAFVDRRAEAAAVIEAITAGLAGLAWHRANIEKHCQPELDFGESDE